MKNKHNFSKKELTQLSVCQYLISQNNYTSQEEIRCSMQKYGFTTISQATISRLLNQLGVIKVPNARGDKVYCIAHSLQNFCIADSLSRMIISIEHNQQFILVRTLTACANYVTQALERQMMAEILGIVYSNDMLWITPADTRQTARVCQQIDDFFKTKKN